MDEWPSDEELNRNRSELVESVKNGTCVFLDGIMSVQTNRLAKAFGADGVDMTSLWAYSPQDWRCPACGRHKTEIVRLNKNNHLMCRLVEHHDHMQELLKRKFEEISSSLRTIVADQLSEAFARRSAAMISSFDNTVVCDDCNVADMNAKRLSGANPWFSYSPEEIGGIIVAKPHSAHAIDHERAIAVWKGNEQTFSLRLKIANRIAEIAATNSHWFQSVDFNFHPAVIERRARDIIDRRRAYGVLDLLVGTKHPAKPADPAGWRLKRYPAAEVRPSVGVIQHVSRVKAEKQWASVDEDWRCAGCCRSKPEVVRITKRKDWSFSLAPRWYRDPSEPRGIAHHALCADCGFVAERLGEEARVRAGKPGGALSCLVSVDEIAQVIRPRPNARHNIDNARAASVVRTIAQRLQDRVCLAPRSLDPMEC